MRRVYKDSLIPLFRVDIPALGPSAAFIPHDLVNGILPVGSVIVDTAEMIPMILHLAVLVASAWKVKAHPSINFILVRDLPGAVVGVDLRGLALLTVVGGELVVEDSIPVDSDAALCSGVAEGHELGFVAPFGGEGRLLLEFPEVVDVVDVVPVAVRGGGFTSGGNPDVVDAELLELGDLFLQTDPVFLVGWDVPLEGLHHGHIFWGRVRGRVPGFEVFAHLEGILGIFVL